MEQGFKCDKKYYNWTPYEKLCLWQALQAWKRKEAGNVFLF